MLCGVPLAGLASMVPSSSSAARCDSCLMEVPHAIAHCIVSHEVSKIISLMAWLLAQEFAAPMCLEVYNYDIRAPSAWQHLGYKVSLLKRKIQQ